ncbi:hypothetical protein Dsin_010974 [Dipteronia sinensis]|uniref:DDE Tnp4 domain-containing protein n=1 Tax=Dipteronia sinensis TaxID=43782 RepID=A0AAE0AUU2_9ROSI|nr:hypothetical protein Dsin_010974 [Dipteronia sinensis]
MEELQGIVQSPPCIVEKCDRENIWHFKSCFTIFKSVPPFPFKTQVEIVLTCVALHNFLLKECQFDEFPIEEESASSSSPIVEEELEELVSQTHEQQRE